MTELVATGSRKSFLRWIRRSISPLARQSGRKRLNRAPAASATDPLEPRLLLTVVNMTDQEQLLLEMINRARANPQNEATGFGIGLNDGLAPGTITTTAKQPLAPHQALVNSAGGHAQDMLNRDYFDHVTKDTTNDPGDRALAAGYPTDAVGENIVWNGTTGTLNNNTAVYRAHESLFRSPGHRENMLDPDYEEVGNGVKYGLFTSSGTTYNAIMGVENFGIRGLDPFITGVVYTDSNHDNFYDIGEAVRAGTVTATNVATGAVFTETIGISGGYGIIVPAGNYVVTAQYTIGGITNRSSKIAIVGTDNIKVDFDSLNPGTVSLSSVSVLNTLNETGTVVSTTITVTRNTGTSFPLTVTLQSNDTTEATVPVSVQIPAGQPSAVFTVNSANDTIIDGNQIARITATAFGFGSTAVNITVTDTNAPSIVGTVQTVNTARPLFSWTGVSNAATYEIWINNATTGDSKVVNVTGIVGTSYTPVVDLGIGTYNVWVRGFTAGGLAGAWSNSGVWRTRPTTVVQGSGRTERAASFQIAWNPIPGASSYDVWIDNATTGTSQYYRNTNVPAANVTVSNFAVGRYSVWVRGQNSRGDRTNWSPAATIYVSYGPTNLAVAAANFNANATLSWGAVPGGVTSDVWIDNLTTGVTQFVRNTNVAGTSLALNTLTTGSYRAWVRVKDGAGVAYGWSSPMDFEFRRAPRVLGPPAAPSVPRPQFSWTRVAGAVEYELVIADTLLNPIRTESHLTDVYFTPDSDLAAGSYRGWIKAIDANGNQLQSTVFSFAVAELSPDTTLRLTEALCLFPLSDSVDAVAPDSRMVISSNPPTEQEPSSECPVVEHREVADQPAETFVSDDSTQPANDAEIMEFVLAHL